MHDSQMCLLRLAVAGRLLEHTRESRGYRVLDLWRSSTCVVPTYTFPYLC
jgi:hypothetical protein